VVLHRIHTGSAACLPVAEDDEGLSAIGHRAAANHRAGVVDVGEVRVRVVHAIIEVRLELVQRRAGSRIAPRPEQLDELLGVGIGRELRPRQLLVVGHDPVHRTIAPLAILRRERGERRQREHHERRNGGPADNGH